MGWFVSLMWPCWHSLISGCRRKYGSNSVAKLLRRFQVADALLQGDGIAPRKSKHTPHIIGRSGAHRAIEEQLAQDVMLGVAAAHALGIGDNWPHQIEGAGIFVVPMCEHPLAHRKRDLTDDGGVVA